MRRPNRIIEIFSMSVLDMFASALGAFIMIAVILFPRFTQHQQLAQTREQIETQTEELERTAEQVRQSKDTSRQQQEEIRRGSEIRTALIACKENRAACAATPTTVFLVIVIEWDEPCDVDLYITDPKARQFYYAAKTIPPSRAELSIDTRQGPGVEVWQNPEAEPGPYQIEYRYAVCPALASGDDEVRIRGWVLDRSAGRRSLPEKILRPGRSTVDVAVVTVSTDGLTTIQER